MSAGEESRLRGFEANEFARRATDASTRRSSSSSSSSPSPPPPPSLRDLRTELGLDLGEISISGGSIRVIRSFDDQDGLGVYLVTLEIEPPVGASTDAILEHRIVVLDLTTFSPPAIDLCFDEPDDDAVQSCFEDEILGFIENGPRRALRVVADEGADGLLVDVSSNGGGLIVLAQAAAIALSPVLGGNPGLAVTPNELRPSTLLRLVAQHYDSESVSSDDLELFPAAGLISLLDGDSPAEEGVQGWTFAYGSSSAPLPVRRHGGTGYEMTSAAYPIPPAAAASLAANSDGIIEYPAVFPGGTLAIATDGQCGSACAQFLRVLADNGLATVLGGRGGL